MLSAASLSFKLYSELSIGVYNCIHRHGDDSIKKKFLPHIVKGTWSVRMCLTEPVCGTDLGLLKTKAVEQSDGSYKVTGQKIFITSGDQDLTKNKLIPFVPEGASGVLARTRWIIFSVRSWSPEVIKIFWPLTL